MQTCNGKLIVPDPPELDEIKRKIEYGSQKIDRLEFQMVAISQKDQAEYLKQIAHLHSSLQKLEQSNHRLLSTIIVSAIALATLHIWSSFNHNSDLVKQPHPTATSRSIKPITTR